MAGVDDVVAVHGSSSPVITANERLTSIAEDVRYLADRARHKDERARLQAEARARMEKRYAEVKARQYELELRARYRAQRRDEYAARARKRFEAVYGKRAAQRRWFDFDYRLRLGPFASKWDHWAWGMSDERPDK